MGGFFFDLHFLMFMCWDGDVGVASSQSVLVVLVVVVVVVVVVVGTNFFCRFETVCLLFV